MDVVISSITDTNGIRVLELAAVDGAALPSYEAGAHIDVTLGNGLVRQYFLCCREPSSAGYRIAVKREAGSRGGSAWLHDMARTGSVLSIGPPRNAFALAPQAGMHLLFAGGIGITPILSMAYTLLRRKQPFRLACYVRDEASLAFSTELRASPLAPYVEVFCGLGPQDTAASIGKLLAAAPANDSHAYVCGPAAFMDAVTAQAEARFGASALHKESFGAVPASGTSEQPFVLRLSRTQCDIAIPAGRSALACLQDAGINIDSSCEVGVCGTCRTAVLDGVPDHQGSLLSAQERKANNCFLPCVSRPLTPVLVIDL
ncbi:vanillate O-demethylase ferredoxin subunit [Collimonas sp. OK607]|nr:vanillate O-demethylase ferredoxin subunit [Collimonas sp. OK607]